MNLVLIVDDIQFERRRIGELVKREGRAYAEAASGIEALMLIDRLKPHLILTDLVMPGMDGLELLSELRCRSIDIPTVVITSDKQEQTHCQCRDLGARGVLTKPWAEEDLIRIIRNTPDVRVDETG